MGEETREGVEEETSEKGRWWEGVRAEGGWAEAESPSGDKLGKKIENQKSRKRRSRKCCSSRP